ncbi:hypothetical protein [Microvirga tunisiensis]|uniref:Uncharacterized protein n=1 Tax=Microvirga tunisiensis TaxID=2108360 RepID=A0A5N7MAB9_9HYPH|nr:hypothetical protein [Microvirga tunisiensis]MPR05652.1 hypothetical protein [Microvirga tunisiensis]MPR23852.1 hypothetical protein [Microvirga tunisiensis]
MTENLTPAAAPSRSRSLLDALIDIISLGVMAILAFAGMGTMNLLLLMVVAAFNLDRYYGHRSLIALTGYNPRALDETRLGTFWLRTMAVMDAPRISVQSGKTVSFRRAVSAYDQVMYVITYWCPFVMFAGANRFFKGNGSLTLIVLAAALIIAIGRYARGVGAARKLAAR